MFSIFDKKNQSNLLHYTIIMLVKSSTHNAARIFGVKMIRLHGYVSLEMKFVNFVNFSFFSFFFFFFFFFFFLNTTNVKP